MLIHPGFDPQSQSNRQKIDGIIDSAEAFSLPSKLLAPIYVMRDDIFTINSLVPELILEGTVEALVPCQLNINAVISSNWRNANGIAIYVNGQSLHTATPPSLQHPDTMFGFSITSGTTSIGFKDFNVMCELPAAGSYLIEIKGHVFYNGASLDMTINGRPGGALKSVSTLSLTEFR